MINTNIACCGCDTVGATYSGHNPMQTLTMKRLLQTKGWSFRYDVDTDEGAGLCPTCFKKGVKSRTLIAYDDSSPPTVTAKLVKPETASGVSRKLVEGGATILYVESVEEVE